VTRDLDLDNPETMGAQELIEDYIEDEIRVRLAKHTSWKQLEPCFKWRRVREYLARKGIPEGHPVVTTCRELLRSNALTGVEYDVVTKLVIRVGIDGL
jgi:hypothetical protein